jgi:uncharacterized lipoprotein YddW (UPF0748 family)
MHPVLHIFSQLRSRTGFLLSRFRSPRHLQKTLIWACLLVFGLTMTRVVASEPSVASSSTTVLHNGAAHQREFRGVWAATVANIDWPSQPGLSVNQQQAELIGVLERMQELNLNALVLQVRPAGDAFYASDLEPWSYWLTGRQGQAPQPFYDPLEFAIAESHKRNIELHAWFNPYRAQNADSYNLAANHMARKFPEYAYSYGDLVWMDPGAKEVQDQTYKVILDVVRRYDIDGIHLDDYFYPYPQDGMDFPDDYTYNAYRRNGGTLARDDWRRDNVNQLVQRLSQGIHAEKPSVKFGISPFGIYRPGQPAGVDGMDQYAAIYADPKLWVEQGWVDYIAPQLYWRISAPQQSYPALLGWWVANNPRRRHIYTGNYLSQLDGAGWPVSEFEEQVALSRKSAKNLSLGNIFFSMKMFSRNSQGVNEVFKSSVYSKPALTPTMEWLDNEPPNPPSGLQAAAGQLSWEGDNSGDVRSWTLYRKQGNTWILDKVLNAQMTNLRVNSGTYGLCAVDALSNESPAAVIDVR